MRISRSPVQGFSLIELLVAVLVIVLLTSVVSLNVGRGGADVELGDDVRHFAAVMGYAQSEAELSGIDHALLLERSGRSDTVRYTGTWLRRYDQGWGKPRTGQDVLAPIDFDGGLELELSLSGRPEIDILERDPARPMEPQIILLASGETIEGALDWVDSRSGELLFRLRWDLLGRTTLMPKGREPDDD